MDFKSYQRARFFKWPGATEELFESFWNTYKGSFSLEEDAFYEGRRLGYESGYEKAKREFEFKGNSAK